MSAKSRGRRRLAVAAATLVTASATSWAQAPPAAPALPLLAQAARTVGVKQCLAAVATVSARTTEGADHQDVILDWDHATPDAKAFFSLTGLEFGQRSAALSLTVVPEATGACSILAERVSGAPIACSLVASHELAGYVGHPLLGTITVYANPKSPRETVTLVNTAPGCLIIRRQVEYGWKIAS